ncbi:MAG: ribonuclease III, partial [Pseudomonadota bacterium]|nr:ribonuclease III [Pseudomonadota bacterium]
MKNKLANFEKNLEYTFKDKNLLIKALTHTSSSQENNEVLEFLGDSVLNLIVTELLLEKFPNENEGFLSLMRSKLVSRKILNKLANGFKLEDFLILGESFKNQEIPEDLLGNALEAILGSIFLENGLQPLRKIFKKKFNKEISLLSKSDLKNSKTILQEYCQKNKFNLPTYNQIEKDEKLNSFVVICRLNEDLQS